MDARKIILGSVAGMQVRKVLNVVLLCSTCIILTASGQMPSGLISSPPTRLIKVGIYDLFEIRISNPKTYSNPFDPNVIDLQTSFISPTGRNVRFFGFYDGNGKGGQTGNVWKLRFMPDELGTWTYTYNWTDGTRGESGSFEVIASPNKGILKIDPLHPHSITYANGEHFFWNGDTEWFFLSDHFTQTARLAAIDFLATKGVNNLLMTMVNDDTYPVFPWISRTDKTRFDLARLKRWEAVVEYMKSKGIIADLWFYSDDSSALYPIADSADENLYFKYIIARFAAYSNVTWNLALEYNEYRSTSWVVSRAQFVKNRDPFNHLLAVHRTDSAWPFAGNPNLDHTSLQHLGADHATLNSYIIKLRRETAQAGRPIPIIHEEFFIEGAFGELDQFRKGIWAITAGGGFYKAASLGWWIGTPYQSAQHFDVAKKLYDFIVKIPYWEMEPRNTLVSRGYALANPGKEYLVYLPSGGSVSVDLSQAVGSLPVGWYNPRTGTYSGQFTAIGGSPRSFTAPDTDDWVLHISEQLSIPAASADLVARLHGFPSSRSPVSN